MELLNGPSAETLQALEAIPANICILAADYHILTASDSYLRTTGTEREQIRGKCVFDIFPANPESPEGNGLMRLEDSLNTVLRTGKPHQMETFRHDLLHHEERPQFVPHYWGSINTPVLDADGNVSYIIHMTTDVTDTILADELTTTNQELRAENAALIEWQERMAHLNRQLKESEERFRSVFEQAPVGMTVLRGPEHIIEQANDNILKIWGRTREEVLGLPHKTARPELNGQRIHEWIDEVYRSGEVRTNRELKVYLKAGTGLREAYVNSVYQPLCDGQNGVAGVLIIIDEVTDRVLSRQQAERAQEQLHMAIESADLGTWYMDAESGAFFPSLRMKELFGFGADEEMTFEGALAQVTDEYREQVREAIERGIRQGIKLDMEHPIIGRNDGRLRWVRTTGMLYQNGITPAQFSGTLLDITERKEIEQRKDDFISVASHELKTPLTTLKSSMQILTKIYASDPMSDKIPDFLGRANRSMALLLHLIDDLMNVSRLQHGKLPLNETRFNLMDLIRESCDRVGVLRTHVLVFNGDTQLEVCADQHRIAQVIVNLVNNAVKYASRSNKIVFEVERTDGSVKVSVQDFGPGIPEEKLTHLFDRYYRVSDSGLQFSGLGLGLYISAEIVDRHGGKIGVLSSLGRGSTFWFTLPLKR
jgi:PAS domain S-box-containing protein